MNSPTRALASRRDFIKTSTATIVGSSLSFGAPACFAALPDGSTAAEEAVKALYDTLNDAQKKEICFDWEHRVDIQWGYSIKPNL